VPRERQGRAPGPGVGRAGAAQEPGAAFPSKEGVRPLMQDGNGVLVCFAGCDLTHSA